MRMVVEIIFLCFVVFIYGVAYGKIRFGRLQPTCNEIATDTISRQATIDAIKNADVCMAWNGEISAEYAADIAVRATKNSVVASIENLPPAQSEIIRCRDCKHRGEKPIADGRYWCELHDTFMYYCSDAERRTDEPN